MSDKRFWIGLIGGGGLAAGLCGFLIWTEFQNIAAARENVRGMHETIAASRKLLTQSGALEREVIVLRETEEAIKDILPNEADVNNFVRDLRRFEEESGIHITGLKKKTESARARNTKEKQADFDKVTYTLTIEADAFQWLAFLDRIESHSRFMTVPSFKLSAAPRRQLEQGTEPYAHKIQMDVETYVYAPQGELAPVKIEGYQRKRELLLGEIARHRNLLAIPTYKYPGPRGRRDPWVDPRIAVDGGDNPVPIEAQNQIVDDLKIRTDEVLDAWSEVKQAGSIIQEMTLRTELEKKLSLLEEDLRSVQAENVITFAPAKNKLEHQIYESIVALRAEMSDVDKSTGPDPARLQGILRQMLSHLDSGDYENAVLAYNQIEGSLRDAEMDDVRKPLVAQIRELYKTAKIAADFEKLKLEIGGIAIMGESRAVIINNKSYSEGDMPHDDLMIKAIREDEIEFIFRGVVLLRRL